MGKIVSGAGLRAVMLVMLAAPLAACVPRPHIAHLRPAVSGTIVEDGNIMPGVELYLGKYPGNNKPCSEVGEPVPVKPDGSFSWPSVQEFRFMDSLLNPVTVSGNITVLCIRHPRKSILIGAMPWIRQHKAASLRLVCDVARLRGSSGLGPSTFSTWIGQDQHCASSSADAAPGSRQAFRPRVKPVILCP